MQVLIIQHVSIEGPGLLQEVLERQGWQLDLRCMDQSEATLPADLNGYRALIILGGPMGAYDEEVYPYLYQVQELIRDAVARTIPTLGICLGAQLIARALGGWVGPNPVKEIGWYRLYLTEAGQKNPLFAGLTPEFSVFQWHQDTFDLPKNAQLLAIGDSCINQGFVVEPAVWALQFHLEVNPAMIAQWAEVYADELMEFGHAATPHELVKETQEQWEEMKPWRERFMQNIELVMRGNSH